jgi:Cysteine-rich secretory protein family
MQYRPLTLPALAVVAAGLVFGMPAAHGDNKRLNESVVANVYTVQHQAGCKNDVKVNPQLQLAAEWHTRDVLNNRSLDGDIGSDGSTAQSRAEAAGYRGKVAETVAINPALAISGVELINQWYYNPAYFAIMADCAHTQIGVWSENSLDRTVVVAVYGNPEVPIPDRPLGPEVGLPPPVVLAENGAMDPSPDYDGSDEIEYGIDWIPWILRGVYPPPAYPPR